MNKLQVRLGELKSMLIDDGYNNSNIVMETLLEIEKEAINYTHSSMELPTKEEMNLALNDKVKGLRSDLKNEFNGDMQVGYNCGWQDCYKEVTNKAIT